MPLPDGLETKTIEQLTAAAGVAAGDLIAVQRPGGAVQKLDVDLLSGGAAAVVAGVSAGQAVASAAQALASAGAAAGSAATALAARDATISAAAAAGIFQTKAEANAALAGLAAGALVRVMRDETQAGATWHYRKTAGVYVSLGEASTVASFLQLIRDPMQSPGSFGFQYVTKLPRHETGAINGAANGGYNDSMQWNRTIKTGEFDFGIHKYFTESMRDGYNNDLAGNAIDTNHSSGYWYIESKFRQSLGGGGFFSEPHLWVHRTRTDPFNDHRVFDITCPEDGDSATSPFATAVLRINQFFLADWAAGQKIEYVLGSADGSVSINHFTRAAYNFSHNDVSPFQQVGPDLVTNYPLPWINTRAELQSTRPWFMQASSETSLYGFSSCFTEVDLTPAPGVVFRYSTINGDVTGSYTTLRFDANVSALMLSTHNNTNVTASARSVIEAQATGGSALFAMTNNGTSRNWAHGGNAASNFDYEICQNYRALGGGAVLRIDYTTRRVRFVAAPAVDYTDTVAALNAAGGQIGARAIATNARKAGEGVGAGTGCPVWHDGTIYRNVYDNLAMAA